MAEEKEELLLQVQADVAKALQEISGLVASINDLNVASAATAKGIKTLGDSTEKTVGGFTRTESKIVTLNAALGLAKEAWGLVADAVHKVKEATIGSAEQFGKFAQSLDNTTKQLGVSAEFYQELQVRLVSLGQSAEGARGSLMFFNRTINAARQGVGQFAQWVQKLNVDIDKSRDIEDIYRDVAKAIADLGSASERSAAATAFFGRSGASQIPLLKDLAEGTQAAKQRMIELGYIMSGDALKAGRQFDSAMSNLDATITSLNQTGASIRAQVFRPLIELTNAVLEPMARALVRNRDAVVELTKAFSVVAAFASASTLIALAASAWGLLTTAIWGAVAALRAFAVAESFATVGISTVVGLLAAGATAWVLYGSKAQEAGSKANDAIDASDSRMKALLSAIEAANSGLREYSRLNAEIAAGGPVAAHGGQPLEISKWTREQEQMREEGRKALQQANDDARVAETQRTQGKVAGIRERAKLDLAEIERQKSIEIEQTKRGVYSKEQLKAIDEKYEDQKKARQERADADEEQAAYDSGQRITSIRVDSEERRQLSELQIQKEGLNKQQAEHEINAIQFLERTKEIEDKEIAIKRAGLEQKLALLAIEPEERKQYQDQIDALNEQAAQKDAAYAAQHAKAAEDYADSVRVMTRRVDDYYMEAFGDPQQKRLTDLARAHEDLVRDLQDAGLVEEIDKVNAAYQRMLSDAKGVVIDVSSVVKTGIEDMFSGVILGTRKSSDVWKAFRESMVKQFSQGFAEALQKKIGFDQKFRLNVTKDLPGYAASGAEKIGANFSSVFNLLGGGSGVGTQVSVSDGMATWVGGAPRVGGSSLGTALSAGTSLLPTSFNGIQYYGGTPAGMSTEAVPVASSASGGLILSNGALAPAVGAAASRSFLGGLGSLALSAAAGGLMFGAMEGGGPLGPLGPIGSMMALSGIPAGSAALLGVASPMLNMVGGLANTLGISGALSSTVGTLGFGSEALSALGLASPVASSVTGGVIMSDGTLAAAGAGAGAGASAAASAIPIIGAIIAALTGLISGGMYIDKANKSPYGGARMTDKDLLTSMTVGMFGKSIGKMVGGIISLPTQWSKKLFGVDPITDMLKWMGVIHTPMPHSTERRIIENEFPKQKWFQELQNKYSVFGYHTGRKGQGYGLQVVSEEFPTSPGFGYRGGASYEKDRPLLEALGVLQIASQGYHPRGKGYPAASIHEFASAWIRDATNMGQSTEQWKKQLSELTDTLTGKNLWKSIEALNQLFDPKMFERFGESGPTGAGVLKNIYAKGVRAFVEQIVEDLPRAAGQAIEEIARAGKVNIDELAAYIESVTAGTDLAKSSLQAAIEAATKDIALSQQEREWAAADKKAAEQEKAAQRKQAALDEQQRKFSFEQQQQDRAASLRSLELQAKQAKAFGDEVLASEIEMQRQMLIRTRQAAAEQEQLRRTQQEAKDKADLESLAREEEKARQLADPKFQFQKAIREGIYNSMISGLVDAFVHSGVVQVALQPFFASLKKEMDTLSSPEATQAEIDASLGRIGSAAQVAYEASLRIYSRTAPILNNPTVQHLFDGTWAQPAYTGGPVSSLYGTGYSSGAGSNPVAVPATIPAMAAGGFITSPTMALLGEAGPEVVVPLNSPMMPRMLSTYGGGGIQVHIHAAVLDGQNVKRLGDAAARVLTSKLRQQRLVGTW